MGRTACACSIPVLSLESNVAESSVKADLEQELTSGRPGVGGRVHARGVKRSVRDASTAVQGMEGRGVNDMEQHVGW